MGEGFISLSRIAWLTGVAALVLVANVAGSILYMVVYGHVIDPGHDQQYYNDHIQIAAPYWSLVAGMPLMFLAGWWVSRWWRGEFAVKSALGVWLAYVIIDVAVILLFGGLPSSLAILFTVSLITKLAAVYAGARFGSRDVS